MRRILLIGWIILTIETWFGSFAFANHFIIARIINEIPIDFYEKINNATLWIVRKFKPEYDPGVLQMMDPGISALIFSTCLICAGIVVSISRFTWRRVLSPRLR
ncbi:hypothetical protein [Paraburkholderia sp. J67]|uniref:hypothetical protein n=1 Tax=Paraburkholderia sp. J67 TaxID=2805435 RepID=UPI002ABD6A31|nr:hypothetical protein [Paraburkholderia sp. J67]